jgi:hypothetical protein
MMWPTITGSNAVFALELYSRSTFCLQPPGDTLPRQGIVDAISVGCIPVLFHPGQATLWPWHWDGKKASVTFDWSNPLNRNGSVVIRELIAMNESRVFALQQELRRVAGMMRYRGYNVVGDAPDAIDALVDGILQPTWSYPQRHLSHLQII